MVLWPQMVTSVVGTVIKGRVRGGKRLGARVQVLESKCTRACARPREGEGGGNE